MTKVCSVDGCDEKHHSRGLCKKHYMRKRRHGSTDVVKQFRGIRGDRIYGDDNARFESYVELIPETSCHWWAGTVCAHGYGEIGIGGKSKLAHRYAYERANGPIPSGMFVCHRCDNKICVNPDHLFLGTNADNVADMVAKDRQVKGEDHGHAKLTEADVIEIRQQRKNGSTFASLSAAFGVSQGAIYWACKRKTWKHVA